MTSTHPVARRRRLARSLALAAAVVTVVVVIWLDIRTGIWQEVVVLSGIAAGLVTFVLTALFLERVLARDAHRRWLPVTQLALTDLLHALAADDSEISRGHVVPRRLTLAGPDRHDGHDGDGDGGDDDDRGDRLPDAVAIEALLADVVEERRNLTDALARWSAFLAASADVAELMRHVAAIAGDLERVRDGAIAVERERRPEDHRELRAAITGYNDRAARVLDEIQQLLARRDDDT